METTGDLAVDKNTTDNVIRTTNEAVPKVLYQKYFVPFGSEFKTDCGFLFK
jgi:hypothetical protein